MRHVCGKLENYSELVQEGRLRVGSAWRYLRHGPDLWPHCRLRLISDLGYWIDKLSIWQQGMAEGQFSIVDGATLAANPAAIKATVTDFSGIDGVGGVSGLLTDPNPRYFSRQLDGHALAAHSSFTGELTGSRLAPRHDTAQLRLSD